MTDTWAVVTAALGASFLTTSATFVLELWREHWSRKQADRDRLREACVQLSSHAVAFIFPVYAQQLTGVYRQGLGEVLDQALFRRKPVDPMELMDRLLVEQKPMLEAQAAIDVLGTQELIGGALQVVLATNGVLDGLVKAKESLDLDASRASPVQRVAAFLSPAQTTLPAEMETALQEGTKRLGQAVRQFARLTRKRLGVNDPEAVIRAYPGLFAEPESEETSKTDEDSSASLTNTKATT